MKIPKILQTISDKLNSLNAKAIIVGGSVRDHFLGLEIKDYDIEVYGLEYLEELENLLKEYGDVKLVGKSFGVLKFVYDGLEYDFAFPRLEKKVGVGHRGFEVVSDGSLSFKEAAKRRDFTINSMGYDIEKDQFLDPFGGKKDLKNGILRHIDDKTFIEDPLRVYRGVQFCARFEFKMDKKTKELCKEMVKRGDLKELPKERVFEELKKLLLKAKKPSIGFRLLDEFGVLKEFEPINRDFKKLDRVSFSKNLAIMLSVLVLGLDKRGIESFVSNLTDEVKLLLDVQSLIDGYNYLKSQNMSDGFIRELSTIVSIEELSIFAEDSKLLKEAKRLGVDKNPPKELLKGRDLIELGYKPSREFSKILDRVYKLQLEGKIKDRDEALEYVKEDLWR